MNMTWLRAEIKRYVDSHLFIKRTSSDYEPTEGVSFADTEVYETFSANLSKIYSVHELNQVYNELKEIRDKAQAAYPRHYEVFWELFSTKIAKMVDGFCIGKEFLRDQLVEQKKNHRSEIMRLEQNHHSEIMQLKKLLVDAGAIPSSSLDSPQETSTKSEASTHWAKDLPYLAASAALKTTLVKRKASESTPSNECEEALPKKRVS